MKKYIAYIDKVFLDVTYFLGHVVLIAEIAALVIFNFRVIPSESMEPTLMTGNIVFCSHGRLSIDDVQRGDIVTFKQPSVRAFHSLVKRVIGLPGDVIQIASGRVIVNGVTLDESDYLPEGTETYDYLDGILAPVEYEVPDGCVFVLGDNRLVSHDSRFWAVPFVPESNLRHKVTTVIESPTVVKWMVKVIFKLEEATIGRAETFVSRVRLQTDAI